MICGKNICGLAATTSALHVECRRRNPGQVHFPTRAAPREHPTAIVPNSYYHYFYYTNNYCRTITTGPVRQQQLPQNPQQLLLPPLLLGTWRQSSLTADDSLGGGYGIGLRRPAALPARAGCRGWGRPFWQMAINMLPKVHSNGGDSAVGSA